MRRGFTLPEAISVIAIVGILLSLAIPPLARTLDVAAVRECVERFAALHETTRQLAIAHGALARLQLDPVQRVATLAVQTPAGWDTVGVHPLGSASITCSNPTIVFGPLGVGYGASNTRVVFSRGAAADTVTTSRTGRLRH